MCVYNTLLCYLNSLTWKLKEGRIPDLRVIAHLRKLYVAQVHDGSNNL